MMFRHPAVFEPQEIKALDRLRSEGTRFGTKCIQCGKPMRDAHSVAVFADVFKDQFVFAIRFWRDLPGAAAWGFPVSTDQAGAPLRGQRRTFACERGHGPWPMKVETWLRLILDAEKYHRPFVYVGS
jgi:hypothetical protein